MQGARDRSSMRRPRVTAAGARQAPSAVTIPAARPPSRSMLQRRKNWSGFRIFWGYKQVAWAIHRSSDSRFTYLPQAHNPGIICIERSKKLRKVRLSDGCSSSNVRALRYGSLKEYRGRCSFWPLWGLRAPSHSLESVQFFLLPMISAARLRSFLAPPSRPTYAVFEVRAR